MTQTNTSRTPRSKSTPPPRDEGLSLKVAMAPATTVRGAVGRIITLKLTMDRAVAVIIAVAAVVYAWLTLT